MHHSNKLNRTLFSLFVCGSLHDPNSGLTYSLSISQRLTYVIEVPYMNNCCMSARDHFQRILPCLSMIVPSANIEEITAENYQLFIGEEEELVGRFLKAYDNKTIDRLLVITNDGKEYPVHFDLLQDPAEVQRHIYNCIEADFPDLPRNKIFELSFTRFLYRRIRFFTGFYYCYNTSIEGLGSLALRQMIQEAKNLTKIDFSSDNYFQCYFVYDPDFSLHLLHNDWSKVPRELKTLFGNFDPSKKCEFENKNYFIECLAWLLDVKYDIFRTIMDENKFILTENFVYKIFHIHERKLTQLPLIIEGETGIGKTFLLNFYAALLNANIYHSHQNNVLVPRITERVSLWLSNNIIVDILEQDQTILEAFLRNIQPQLSNQEDDPQNEEIEIEIDPPLIDPDEEDENETEEIQVSDTNTILGNSLRNFQCDNTMLRCIWKTLVNTVDNRADLTNELDNALRQLVNCCIEDFPLIEISNPLKQLLESTENKPQKGVLLKIFDEFLTRTSMKRVFYRLLLHPGITEKHIGEFLFPILQLAQCLPKIELVVFFDEVNTSSCLGLFKEIFMDRTLHGQALPKNIFFTAAINPASKPCDSADKIHRQDYLVHELPDSLKTLKISYGIVNQNTLKDYIRQKIATFTMSSPGDYQTSSSLDEYLQETLIESILAAQEFCVRRLG